jgi:hypothetical protein
MASLDEMRASGRLFLEGRVPTEVRALLSSAFAQRDLDDKAPGRPLVPMVPSTTPRLVGDRPRLLLSHPVPPALTGPTTDALVAVIAASLADLPGVRVSVDAHRDAALLFIDVDRGDRSPEDVAVEIDRRLSSLSASRPSRALLETAVASARAFRVEERACVGCTARISATSLLRGTSDRAPEIGDAEASSALLFPRSLRSVVVVPR